MGTLGAHAVVIGGSVAGLLAARVLADHFERVSVLERDLIAPMAAARKCVPQGAHVHALLLGGEQAMSSLYPGFTEALLGAGAVPLRAGRDIAYYLPSGKAYTPDGAMRQPRDLGFDVYGATRELIEHCLRQQALRVPNLRFERAMVQGLLCDAGHVRGVRCAMGESPARVQADLVVDATGRGSHAPRWLADLGFEPVRETLIGIDMAYASACLRLPAGKAGEERRLVFHGPAPSYRRSAMLTRVEGGLWQLTLAGRFGEDPPFDEPGFRAFARSLHSPRLHELIEKAERVGEIAQCQFPTSVRRHYERLAVPPERWLALGDAICSFNPIYGQGMTVAALQCRALRRLLERRARSGRGNHPLERIGPAFFDLAAQVCHAAWTLAAAADFAFPQTRGTRPAGLAERSHCAAALGSLVPEDPRLHRLLAEVAHLARPPSALSRYMRKDRT